MKQKTTLYFKLWHIYLLVYIFYFALLELLPVRDINEGFDIPYLYTLIGIFGVLLIICDVFTRRTVLRIQGIDLLMMFFIGTVISIVVNYQYDFMGNIKSVMWTAIHILLLSALDPDVPKETHIKWLSYIFDVFILFWMFAIMWSLLQFLKQDTGLITVIRADRVQNLNYGFTGGRLFGIFQDPNYAAVASLFSIGFAVFCICWGNRPKVLNIYYIFNILMQLFYVILSGSRSAKLSVVLIVFVVTVFLVGMYIQKSVVKRLTIAFVAGVLSVGVVLIGFKTIQTGLSYLPSIVQMAENKADTPIKSEESVTITSSETVDTVKEIMMAVDLTRDDVENKKDYSNNRFSIWSDYWKVFMDTPIFGTSPRGIFLYAQEQFEGLYIFNRPYKNTHNAYLQLFTSVGIMGGLLMMLWIIYVLVIVFGYLIRRWDKDDKNYWMIFVFTLMLMMYAIVNMTFSGIFFANIVIDVLFWLVMGITLYLIRQSEPERYDKLSVTQKVFDRIFARLLPNKNS